MSLLGIDTSQLISRYQNNESEWNDVEDALAKAFPGQSAAELHAAATIFIAENPDATMDELLAALQTQFSVEISAELVTEIRKEWDEFSTSSDLSPAELLAVLDDYDGDAVDTSSQAYLLFLMQTLQKEIEKITSETVGTESEVDRARYEAAKADVNEQIKDLDKKTSGGFLKWLGAAAAVVAAVISVAVAVAVSVASGGTAAVFAVTAAVIACTLAVSAIAGAASDGKYSIAGLVAQGLEACGVDEQTAQWIGIGVEVALAVAGAVCSLGVGLLASGASAASTGANTAATVAKTTEKFEQLAILMSKVVCALQVATGVAQGVKAVIDYDYTMSQAELTELRAIMEKLLQILKAKQALTEELLQTIFDAMRGTVSESTEGYLDSLLKAANPEMA